MSIPSDRDAAIATKRHSDAAAFDAIVREHGAAIAGYLRARVVDAELASRLTDEVFFRLARKPSIAGDADGLRQTLLQIARALLERDADTWTALCLDLDDGPAAERVVDRAAQVKSVMERLEPAQRDAIELAYGSGRTISQIGERLRRSEAGVRQLLFRARQSLQEELT